MSVRKSRAALGLLVVAALMVLPGLCWAVYYKLEPSKNDWGLKYEVAISDADDEKTNVVFTLADEGRLKPIHSATVVAFSKPDASGGQTYDVKAPFEFKATADSKKAGQVQIPKKFAARAEIRILTLTVDGKRYQSARYYELPLTKKADMGGTAPSKNEPASP